LNRKVALVSTSSIAKKRVLRPGKIFEKETLITYPVETDSDWIFLNIFSKTLPVISTCQNPPQRS